MTSYMKAIQAILYTAYWGIYFLGYASVHII